MLARRAFVVSAAVHVGMIALIASGQLTIMPPQPPPATTAPIEPIEITPAPPQPSAPIEVTLLDPETEVPATRPPDRTSGGAMRSPTTPQPGVRAGPPAQITTQPRGPGEETRPGEPSAPGPGSNMLRMRGPELGVPETATDDFLARSKPLEQGPQESGRLKQHGREYVARDSQVPAQIHEDGTVTFHDRGDAALGLVPPEAPPVGVDPGNSNAQNHGAANGVGVGGTLDVSAYAMRKLGGGDPYATRKRKLLAETFDQRAEIGARHLAHELARSAELMRRNLVRLWRTKVAPVARREALFALWDECFEGDSEQGQAGDRARAIVIGWIRSHVAQGSADAYTAAEITALDARRTSKQHFAPY